LAVFISSLAALTVAAPTMERTGPCVQEKLRVGQEMPGKYVPQCTKSGYYQTKQCHFSTGQCWCADPDTGKELGGSRVAPGQGEPSCPPCHTKRAMFLQPFGMIGSYAPSCDEYGLFTPTQHHGSTGQSWCVDRFTGEEFEETRRTPGQGMPECSGSRYCQKNETEHRPCCAAYFQESSSVYRMECTKNGYFKVEQVVPYGTEMVHFCVDPATGIQAQETHAPRCGACFKNNEDKLSAKLLLGSQLPKCNTQTGNYEELQKNFEGYRWCVDPLTGAMVGEERRFDDKTPLPCEH